MKRETVMVLAKHALFRKFSQAEKAALFSRFREEDLGSNTLIFQEDSQGDSLYVVISGTVLLQAELNDVPVPIAQLQSGETFGEIAVLNPGKRMLTAKAIAPGRLARLPHSALAEFDELHPKAGVTLRSKLLEHFLIKIRHLQPLWNQLMIQGLQHLEAGDGLNDRT